MKELGIPRGRHVVATNPTFPMLVGRFRHKGGLQIMSHANSPHTSHVPFEGETQAPAPFFSLRLGGKLVSPLHQYYRKRFRGVEAKAHVVGAFRGAGLCQHPAERSLCVHQRLLRPCSYTSSLWGVAPEHLAAAPKRAHLGFRVARRLCSGRKAQGAGKLCVAAPSLPWKTQHP